MAVGDWASRHDRYANPLHGRVAGGQVAPMSWHCEDAWLNWSVLPKVREEWTAIAQRYINEYDIFDNWGMYCYTSASYKPWGNCSPGSTSASGGEARQRQLGGMGAFTTELAKVSLKYTVDENARPPLDRPCRTRPEEIRRRIRT